MCGECSCAHALRARARRRCRRCCATCADRDCGLQHRGLRSRRLSSWRCLRQASASMPRRLWPSVLFVLQRSCGGSSRRRGASTGGRECSRNMPQRSVAGRQSPARGGYSIRGISSKCAKNFARRSRARRSAATLQPRDRDTSPVHVIEVRVLRARFRARTLAPSAYCSFAQLGTASRKRVRSTSVVMNRATPRGSA